MKSGSNGGIENGRSVDAYLIIAANLAGERLVLHGDVHVRPTPMPVEFLFGNVGALFEKEHDLDVSGFWGKGGGVGGGGHCE